jgi:cytochrome c6
MHSFQKPSLIQVQIKLSICVVLFGVAALGTRATAQTPDKMAAAETAFKANCTTCHNEDGSGTPVGMSLKVKDLRSKEVQDEKDEVLAHTISAGKNNMPGFGTRLSDEQIKDLIEYIRHKAPASH